MSTQCYRLTYIGLGPVLAKPCPNQNPSAGGFVGCCLEGDACLADFLCAYSHPLGGGSGFYTQSCTDPTFQDSACNQHCTDQHDSGVVYNGTTASWACCGAITIDSDLGPNCGSPTDETFTAAPLWDFFQSAGAVVGSTTTPSSTTSGTSSTSLQSGSTSSPSVSATPTQHNPPHSSSDWPKGEEIGVGLGVAVAVLAVVGFVIWRIALGRRMLRLETQKQSSQLYERYPQPGTPEVGTTAVPEMPNTSHYSDSQKDSGHLWTRHEIE